MADTRLAWLPATELAALIQKKKVSPIEVVDAVLDRIEKRPWAQHRPVLG